MNVATVAAALLVAQQVGGKATRDSLFLASFPAEALPQVMVITALASIAAVVLLSGVLSRVPPARVVPGVLALSADERAKRHIARLEAKIDGLALVSQAMWELLRERTQLTENDIRAKVSEIDARDGRLDGRMLGTSLKCEGCGRDVHTRQQACMYCGAAVRREHVFDR